MRLGPNKFIAASKLVTQYFEKNYHERNAEVILRKNTQNKERLIFLNVCFCKGNRELNNGYIELTSHGIYTVLFFIFVLKTLEEIYFQVYDIINKAGLRKLRRLFIMGQMCIQFYFFPLKHEIFFLFLSTLKRFKFLYTSRASIFFTNNILIIFYTFKEEAKKFGDHKYKISYIMTRKKCLYLI